MPHTITTFVFHWSIGIYLAWKKKPSRGGEKHTYTWMWKWMREKIIAHGARNGGSNCSVSAQHWRWRIVLFAFAYTDYSGTLWSSESYFLSVGCSSSVPRSPGLSSFCICATRSLFWWLVLIECIIIIIHDTTGATEPNATQIVEDRILDTLGHIHQSENM